MPDRWQTYAFEFKGGLLSNLSPLQQGVQAPGSARILRNFEPSIDGGYRKVLGYTKYDDANVPSYGFPVVQGSGQSGNTLIIANLSASPAEGDTFTIAGVTGTYTVDVGGVSYNATGRQATLTLTPALASSPADKAAVTFSANSGLIRGIAAWEGDVIAQRNSMMYKSSGSGWTQINVSQYGTPLVQGAGQTGTSLTIDGLTEVPQAGDVFQVAGIEKVYLITAQPTVSSGATTLSITPALATSPADNAVITFLTAYRASTNKSRFAKYRIGTSEKIVSVDGTNYPFIYDGTTYTPLNSAPADVYAASHAVFFKNQLFFAKGESIVFTAPYTDNDFNVANGSGTVNVGSRITGLIVFREQLIIFSEDKISQLVGNTIADFQLQPITRNIGCVDTDTIQEVAGDVMFLGPDGLRLLSATDRIGDFNLAVVSKTIQKEATELISSNDSFASVVVRKKSQYRLFGYREATASNSAPGILGTQLAGDSGTYFGWAETRGFKAYVADSSYFNREELVVFANEQGYAYQMETGYSFDGANIVATFSTPFVPAGDIRVRKTFYKMFLYTDPRGSVNLSANLKLDFDTEGIIQPDTLTVGNTTGSVGFYGSPLALYGTTVYGSKLTKIFETQTVGSGFSVSLQFLSNDTDPSFSLDAATLEFATHDRR